jgi:hypothetical protein
MPGTESQSPWPDLSDSGRNLHPDAPDGGTGPGFSRPPGPVSGLTLTADSPAAAFASQDISRPSAEDQHAGTRKAIIAAIRAKGASFVERRDWAARPVDTSKMTPDWNYSSIAIHHAGRSFSCGPIGMAALQMQEIQSEQMSRIKAEDIGYHFALDCNGIVYEGRDIRFKGENVRAHNSRLIGIVLLENLTDPPEGGDAIAKVRTLLDKVGVGDRPIVPTRQGEVLRSLIGVLRKYFSIGVLGGHREFPDQAAEGKICPGNVGIALVEQLRKETGLAAP